MTTITTWEDRYNNTAGFSVEQCMQAEITALRAALTTKPEVSAVDVELPGPVAARWPSVPGSHHYAGAGGCMPNSFGEGSEDLYTTSQMQDYARQAVSAALAKQALRIDALETIVSTMPELESEISDLRSELAKQAGQSEAVAFVKFKNGAVDFETDDNIVISNTSGDCMDDSIEWKPVYTTPQPSPVAQPVNAEFGFDVTIEDEPAKMLRAFLTSPLDGDDDPTPIRLLVGNGHSGYGLYLAAAEYPEEGAQLLAELSRTQAAQPQQKEGE